MYRIRIIYLFSLLLASFAAWGQQYRVCDVSSAPASVWMGNGKNVVRNIVLEGDETLKFEKFAKISLMETKSKEMFFHSGEGVLKVADVVGRNRTQLKSNLKAHLKDLLQGKSHFKMAGVVYKDLASPVNYIDGDNLLLADSEGNIIEKNDIDKNGIYYFVVSNTSTAPCFANVIRTDSYGNSVACCISDDALAQMDLMVPAESSVMLTAFPQLGKNLISTTLKVAVSETPFDPVDFLDKDANIRVLAPHHMSTVSYPEIAVRFLVKDNREIKSVDLFLNGKETCNGTAVVEGINEIKVRLAGYGENLIELRAKDKSGNGFSKTIKVNYDRINKPKLHILSVGIGGYKDKNIEKLHFAASDAAMVAKVLDTLCSVNNRLYEGVGYRMLLADEDATREKILKSLDDIRYGANPEDIVMLYMSGHGKYVEFTSQRYFLPYDAGDDKYIESTAISYRDLKEKLKQLEDMECKVIVYMDACYAGEMYFTKAAENFIGDSDPAVIGFYSSTRNQPSLEKMELNHGVFTYALLNGLKGGAGDSNGNITITSLGDYIAEQVRIESQGRQTPKVDNGGEDFILFRAGDGKLDVASSDVSYLKPVKDKLPDKGNDPVVELARSYYTGEAIAATMEDEFNAYVAAAGLGDANSMYMTGVCYETGRGCGRDSSEAFIWYGKAAEEGVAAAQYNLGTMFYNGTGVTKSEEQAEKWFLEAERKGYAMASTALGYLYYHKAVPEFKKAFVFFSRSAKSGDAMALFYLGECYLYGYGTTENIPAALDAYKKSAEKGYAAAEEKLMEIDY